MQLGTMLNLLLVLLFCGVLHATNGMAQLEWRVSVKRILDADSNPPSGGNGNVGSTAAIEAQIDSANHVLDATGRGYRLKLTEIIDLPGVSQWFDSAIDWMNETALETNARLQPIKYAWRSDAINIYVNNSSGSGICSFPPVPEIILIGQNARPTTFIHEIGHYLGLCHSQGCLCAGCDSISLLGTQLQICTEPGDDGINDTLPDVECWDRDQIAMRSFQTSYGELPPERRTDVNNVFFNIMSYHSDRDRLTEDQMDKATDASNGPRSHVTTGRTRFVDGTARCPMHNGSSGCGVLAGPYPTVLDGIDAANPGDIVLVRPGHYNERIPITKAVTLRATRGAVAIGIP